MDIKKDSQTPFLYENKESNTMVIFVHGILEGPKQFRKFTEVVYNKGFSYSAILLDGHGGSGKKFANSSMKKWINSVEKEILKYKDKYENIILVGHSMGGLLSILLSLKYKNKVKSLILISTPLKVHVRFDMMISSIKIALGKIKDEDTLTKYAYNALSVDRSSLVTYARWIPRYKDLFELIVMVKRELKNIAIPTLIIHTKKDELVSNKSLNLFYKNLKNDYKIINLEKSGHFYYDEDELNKILKVFQRFLEGTIS